MNTPWWGEVHTLDAGQSLTLRLGELRLTAERLDSEWNFYWNHDSAIERGSEIERGRAGENAAGSVFNCRYPFRAVLPGIRFEPNLADRPLVVHPVMPLYIPPAETLTLWISSPLWCRVILCGTRAVSLNLDLPTVQLSETWFGPDTLNGEVGYASRTRARMNPGAEPEDCADHRARTPVVIHNGVSDIIKIERLNLPLQTCVLYEGPNGLITDTVVWERQIRGQKGSISLAAPETGRRISGPRKPESATVLSRAFDLLFD
ncbi:hypothetical protein B1B_16494 [mine drainage metagenome]|uniref:Uncharacterized protein n=1 Tax=mine drainage metagenome TaxID=410659 RepID=T1A3Q7_9ZZZZ